MSKREIYEAKTEAFLQPIVDEYGFELVDVEYVKEGGKLGIFAPTSYKPGRNQCG